MDGRPSQYPEDPRIRPVVSRFRWLSRFLLRGALVTGGAFIAISAFGQPQQSDSTQAPSIPATVPQGTRFLIRLDDELRTDRTTKINQKFKATTLEPLQTADGIVLPPDAEIRGHISRIEPASLTGRARLWLTFDDIHTRYGKRPLIAEVVSVPGEHSVKRGESKEGEIEARTSKGREELEAAGAGAAMGAAAGAKAKNAKAAAIGAAVGGAAGFLIASGMGQELDLPKGTKIEIELIRPLYLARN